MMTKALRNLIVLATPFMASLALAAEEAHHAGAHEVEGIPSVIYFQAINFILFAGLIIFFLRKPTAAFFSSKVTGYRAAVERGEMARREAEAKRAEIAKRIQALEASTAQSIEKAKADSAGLAAQLNRDAQELSERLKLEATKTVQHEIVRARQALHDEMLQQALEVSKTLLKNKIAENDQQRLQSESVDKMKTQTSEAR